MAQTHLRIQRFAQLGDVDLRLGDLTVFVGPQATGKSLALQLLKLGLDGRRILGTLSRFGFDPRTTEALSELYFGEGMGAAWKSNTRLAVAGKPMSPKTLLSSKRASGEESVFYIPAQRALTIVNGLPQAFERFTPDTPFVVRQFSEQLRQLSDQPRSIRQLLFPAAGRLKGPIRDAIDRAIFHRARLRISPSRARRQLKLTVAGGLELPFMAWTAGQREFIPLLLGLYHLLPSDRVKVKGIDWVIVEEPEMGLHPNGIIAALLPLIDLVARGYRVVLSTHHPLVLDVFWLLRRLQGQRGGAVRMCEAFNVNKKNVSVYYAFKKVLERNIAVFSFDYGTGGTVDVQDISDLDPSSDNEVERGWGGLTGVSSRIADAVAKASNQADVES